MKQSINTTIYTVLGLIGLIFLFRFMPFLVRPLMLLLVLGLVGLLIYYVIESQKEPQDVDSQSDVEKGIKEKLAYCERQIMDVRKEKKEIERNIVALESKLFSNIEITPQAKIESQRLIKEFQKEFELRQAKKAFYETCVGKLQALLQNIQLTKEIETQQEKLRKLRENNEDDIVNFEELKTSLEFEQTYLSTIDKLSMKMMDSNSLQDAKALQNELEEITKELREL